MTPWSPVKINQRFGGKYRLSLLWFMQGFRFIYSSTAKMEVICSSETPIEFHRTRRCHILENTTLHRYWCENLNKSKFLIGFEVLKSVGMSPIFKVKRTFGGLCGHLLQGRRISQAINQQAAEPHASLLLDGCSSETSVVFQQTTRHYIPEDRTLH
jgi:hypothetical protein